MAQSTARRSVKAEVNKLLPEDRPAHDWYRFVLSYPPHLVRDYAERFHLTAHQRVLDPFCGTGTTIVECKRLGIPSVGIEANPMAHFASRQKVNWSCDADRLLRHAQQVADQVHEQLLREGINDDDLALFQTKTRQRRGQLRTLTPDSESLILADSISALPLHKTLVLLEACRANRNEETHGHELLALAKAVVFHISNLHFGPEVGVAPAKKDAPVIGPWLEGVTRIAKDLRTLQHLVHVPAVVHHADSRRVAEVVEPNSIDAVITSPPYPNEKDYTRTTRLESVLLGFVRNKAQLRALKKGLVRSNTRGVYKEDDDDRWIADHPEIHTIADRIEARRLELGKTSGFERMYPRVTRLYFGGMARHLAELRAVLRPGAQLAYVVGDQASYLRVMIRTGQLLGDIAQALGYELVGIDLFRTRLATATQEQLREEVVVLRWPGAPSG